MAPASPPDTVLTISGSFLNFCCKERRGTRGVGRGGGGGGWGEIRRVVEERGKEGGRWRHWKYVGANDACEVACVYLGHIRGAYLDLLKYHGHNGLYLFLQH